MLTDTPFLLGTPTTNFFVTIWLTAQGLRGRKWTINYLAYICRQPQLRIRCFSCHNYGHLSTNCPLKSTNTRYSTSNNNKNNNNVTNNNNLPVAHEQQLSLYQSQPLSCPPATINITNMPHMSIFQQRTVYHFLLPIRP